MTRRGHELDRSDFFGDLFGTILPSKYNGRNFELSLTEVFV